MLVHLHSDSGSVFEAPSHAILSGHSSFKESFLQALVSGNRICPVRSSKTAVVSIASKPAPTSAARADGQRRLCRPGADSCGTVRQQFPPSAPRSTAAWIRGTGAARRVTRRRCTDQHRPSTCLSFQQITRHVLGAEDSLLNCTIFHERSMRAI